MYGLGRFDMTVIGLSWASLAKGIHNMYYII